MPDEQISGRGDVVGYLINIIPLGPSSDNILTLSNGKFILGRDEDCDLPVASSLGSISRRHLKLSWQGEHFEIQDLDSFYGTKLAGHPLENEEIHVVHHGQLIELGDTQWTLIYRNAASFKEEETLSFDIIQLIREMSSLDITVLVPRALDLVKLISGYEEAHLVSTEDRWHWPSEQGARLIRETSRLLNDPELEVSRTRIMSVLETGENCSDLIAGDAPPDLPQSVISLDLKRIWIAPVMGLDDRPMAVIYLHSRGQGAMPGKEKEALLNSVVEQISLLIRNAWLHDETRVINEELEDRVRERTRELEESRAKLVSQDRLATLGRLVAGIAHELNNPSGAIASLSETQAGMLDSIVRLRADLLSRYEDPQTADSALVLLDLVKEKAGQVPPDTRARRERERQIAELFETEGIAKGDWYARTLARTSLSIENIREHCGAFSEAGDALIEGIEKLHTFARASRTIRDASRNIAHIVGGLKQYSHLDQAEMMTKDIHDGLQAMLDVMASRIPAGIKVIRNYDELPPIPHRPGEMTQVWTNLVDNAIQAMGESGQLVLGTSQEGDMAVITIEDSGPGISPELHESLFELDTTTKGPGAGLGLGLPICRTIIENHGGTIGFTTEPGRTVFTVRLPIAYRDHKTKGA